jgi:transcriptional regulator with XRE-family HTH domain
MARGGLTQSTLARKIGRSQQYVSRRLCGAVAFSPDELALVADAIGVPVAVLMESPPNTGAVK